ncbi:hypothetical protein RUM43_007798 [Polyplax serrata]|uniref:Uncharacterized protein n=1 Tax=Polyplax serrata TaxID=468196 RepID=A0AAN8S5R5_POLSC
MVCIIEKELTAEIRRLCKIEMEDPNRGKSLPYRLPNTLFMFYKASRTGPTAYYMTMSQYFRKIHIIRDETTEDRRYYALLNHWHRIPPYRPWCPHVLVGGIRRINPMTGTTQRQIQKPGNCKCNCKRDEIPCVLGM